MAQAIRSARKRRQDIRGALLISVVVLIVLGMSGLYVMWAISRPSIDPKTFCSTEGPNAVTVVLIDRTDALNAVQRQSLSNHLDTIVAELPRGGGIQLFTVRPFGELLKPASALMCSPGRGTSASRWLENPRLVERRWQERFQTPLQRAINDALTTQDAERSPLFEAIQSIAVTALSNTQQARHLVIVSDMLQNTDDLSQYNAIATFDTFRLTPYYRRIRADLAGVDVQVFYIRREGFHQGRAHIEFWQDYFADTGARLIRVASIDG